MSLRSLVPPVLIVIASALGTAGCTSASSSTPPAAASPASSPPASSPAALAPPVPGQFTGAQLESALLPATDFGQDAAAASRFSSGRQLLDKPAVEQVATMSCETLLRAFGASSALGQTAYTGELVAFTSGPAVAMTYAQFVIQFARPSAAAALYTQLTATYARCVSFTARSTVVNHIQLSETVRSVSRMLAGGHQAVAIIVSETAYVPGGEGRSVTKPSDLIITADGVDVLSVGRASPGSPQAPAALLVKLIASVKALG